MMRASEMNVRIRLDNVSRSLEVGGGGMMAAEGEREDMEVEL